MGTKNSCSRLRKWQVQSSWGRSMLEDARTEGRHIWWKVKRDDRRRQWQPTAVLLPGKSHGRRGLVGCSPWGHEVRHLLSNFTFTFHFHALEKKMATHSSVLAWRIPGTAEPGGLLSDWSDLAAKRDDIREAGARSCKNLRDNHKDFRFDCCTKGK